MKQIDITGQRFGRLVAIEMAFKKNYRSHWRCKCDCGNEIIVDLGNLRSGHTKSCGCYKAEKASETHMKHGHARKACRDRLYPVWRSMKQRCALENSKAYHWYGERGISVCAEWKDYKTFKDWAYSNGYNPSAKRGDCTIDRIDVNGNYEPSNCRFVSMKIQNLNKRKGVTHG